MMPQSTKNIQAPRIQMPWSSIDTLLIDMDGTLLDLHFDNYFWQEYIPKVFADKNSMSLSASLQKLASYSKEVQGSLDWYCLDYWSDLLKLDIVKLKMDVGDKIGFRPNAINFLDFIKTLDKQIILTTNAHPKTLELKLLKADFSEYFCHLVSSHDLGYAKENNIFWDMLTSQYALTPSKCLFIDDSLSILKVAKTFGIGHLLAIEQPDSKKASIDCFPFNSIQDFSQLISE